jgi:transposase
MAKTTTQDADTAAAIVTLGVDTHQDAHLGVALDQLGRRLGHLSVPTTVAGYEELLQWAEGFGELGGVGVEGTGCYGAGLTRFLNSSGIEVFEVGRPKRRHRRGSGKSDTIDAEEAARAVLAGTDIGTPKVADGRVEMIRSLRAVRHSAVKARTQAVNQLKALVVTAPEELRARLRELSTTELVAATARLRPGPCPQNPKESTKFAMRSVARRHQSLCKEIAELEEQLDRLVTEVSPELVSIKGVGPETAATLLVAAGDNPERLRSESAFAHLCGVAPIPASSGKTVRHRLNRRGNRDANRALYIIAVVRLRWDERSRAYAARRAAEGKTKKEIIRCLKRYIAREIYRLLLATGAVPTIEDPAPEVAP